MTLDRFTIGMELKSRVEQSGNTHQNHEVCGKEIHDELQGIPEVKSPNQGFDAVYEKKKGK